MNGIKRKIAAAKPQPNAAPCGAGAAWKLALARAARDAISLGLSVTSLRQDRRSLAELLELLPDRALIAVLEGPKDGLGLIVLSPEVLTGLIEIQTVGRVSKSPPLIRKPTRTDAAMVAGVLDKALAGLEMMLDHDEDLIWAGGFRYASFLEDARPLELLLEDMSYQVLAAETSIEDDARTGQVLLCVPATGRGRQPAPPPLPPSSSMAMVFAAALDEQVMGAEAMLTAVVARVTLPLQSILQFRPDDTVPLGTAALDQIDLEAIGGGRLAGGRLGQNRGMRAVRMLADAMPAVRVKIKMPAAIAKQSDSLQNRSAG